LAACAAEPCDDGFTYDREDGEVTFHGVTCALLRDGAHHTLRFDPQP
jgi:hypothetical protein